MREVRIQSAGRLEILDRILKIIALLIQLLKTVEKNNVCFNVWHL